MGVERPRAFLYPFWDKILQGKALSWLSRFYFTPLCIVVSDLVIPIWCHSGPVLVTVDRAQPSCCFWNGSGSTEKSQHMKVCEPVCTQCERHVQTMAVSLSIVWEACN